MVSIFLRTLICLSTCPFARQAPVAMNIFLDSKKNPALVNTFKTVSSLSNACSGFSAVIKMSSTKTTTYSWARLPRASNTARWKTLPAFLRPKGTAKYSQVP
uniref:Secreted protein n=1 Tax=Cacopsylla melanoneura TaxID=428564 RepID=A0A8D8XQY7_9HEMI